MKPLSVFISCSFNEKYSGIVEYVSNVIKSLGYLPKLLKVSEGKPIPEKIRDGIGQCDVFLLVILEDLSQYILNEIGIAYALQKKFIVLSKKDVNLSGSIIDKIVDYVCFDIDQYWYFTPELIALLNHANKELLPSYISKDYIIRKSVKCKMTLLSSELITQTEIEMINLSGELKEINHGLILYDEIEQQKANTLNFNFSMLYPSDTAYSIQNWEYGNAKYFKVSFDEPIIEMQAIRYMYEQNLNNYFPMSNKEIYHRLLSGRYHITEPYAEKNYTISTPTEHLSMELNFPDKCKISEQRVIVTYYKGDNRNYEEEKRLSERKALKLEKEYNKEKIVLEIDYPKTFMKYSIQWRYYEPNLSSKGEI